MAAGSAPVITSLERGLRVLQAFSASGAQLTLTEVAALAQLRPASARRSLQILQSLGYVSRVKRRFYLRPRTLSLGACYLRSIKADVIFYPVLQTITSHTRCDSAVTVLDAPDVVCIAHVASNRQLRPSALGVRYPALDTAAGQVLLAYALEQPLMEQPGLSEGSIAAFASVLRTVRANGFSMVNNELESGVWSVAVPFVGRDNLVVGAVSCSNVTHRPDPEATTRSCLAVLQSAAHDMERALRLQSGFVLAS